MPDDKLFEAAAAGKLNSPEEIASRGPPPAGRRQGQGRHRATSTCSGWRSAAWPTCRRTRASRTTRPAVAQAMATRDRGRVRQTACSSAPRPTASWRRCSPRRRSFVDAGLAKLYGVTGVTGTDMKEVDLTPAKRAGIFTQGSFLATKADAGDVAPRHARRHCSCTGCCASTWWCRRPCEVPAGGRAQPRQDHPRALRASTAPTSAPGPATSSSTRSGSPSRTTTPSAPTGRPRTTSRSTPAAA